MLNKIDLKLKLKIMYILTIVGAGSFGLLMLIVPNFMVTLFLFPAQDPYTFGIVAAVYFAFGILAIFGLYDRYLKITQIWTIGDL